MISKSIITALTVLVMIFSFPAINYAQTLSAKEIIQKADDKGRGKTSSGSMTLTIIRPDWTRSISLKSWTKGTEYTLIFITSPAKDKGQVFLKRQKNMWNWIPSIERIIKIPPSMMLQSWMGSDYNNDDLVKESSLVTDYSHKLSGFENVRDQKCYKVELNPLPDAAVTWGKIILWITVEGFNQWKAEYYDEDKHLINIMNAYNIRKMGDREIPTRLVIEPADQKGKKTILEINSITFNQPISDNFFSLQNLKTVR